MARGKRLGSLLCVLAGLRPQGAGATVSAPERPKLRAIPCEQAPEIDGKLDDAVWAAAEPIGGFTQVEPREGEPPTERTEVRALCDADHLYLGIRCFDREPGRIIATQMKRDADLDTDDRVLVVIDTFEDRRNGYLFEMNPAGAKLDALIASNGEEVNESWDAIWEGRATIDEQGWSVELALPFKSLSFRPELESWGLNVQRVIKRRLENDRWASPHRNQSVLQVSEAGTLEGLAGIRQGLGLDVVPFFTAHWTEEEDGDEDLTGEPGFDAFYRLTSGLTAALTVNTDFAETEVDQRQINLTRFPLFFPEKRDFFLQDAGIFEFADLGNDLVPFFSRRIGLTDEGEEVPILVGGKLTGRAGPYNLGFLGAHTEAAHDFDASDLFVGRILRNVGEQSSVGGIFTVGDPNGRDENALVGLDANFGTSSFLGDRNLRSSLWALGTDDDGTEGAAFGASLVYPNDIWSWGLAAKEIQEDFSPALGFVPRTGVRKYTGELAFEPVINRAVRRLEFGAESTVVTDLDDEVESAESPLQFLGIVWDAGDELKLQAIPAYERLDEPFEIQDDVTLPVGSYDWLRWRIEAESALKRPVSGLAAVEIGDFFDGTRVDLFGEVSWRPSRYFTGELSYEQSQVDLDEGSFVTHLGAARLDLAFSPDLTWSNFIQVDNESETLGWNSRMQWILHPGEEVNFVYNHTVEREDGDLATVSQGAAIKLQYTLRW
jgi:Domain of unknown function (DUF5916)/Carbohydrate family 9 binding domain-like